MASLTFILYLPSAEKTVLWGGRLWRRVARGWLRSGSCGSITKLLP
ncbi:MAG: hypothetical protein ACNS62_04730 [Candidatus Cyclobacteriaceae bacterium M3_2C_046]